MLLNNLSVKVKLFIIGSLGLLGALAVQGLLLHMERNHLIDSHKVELRHLTEVVTDILSVYQSQEATLGKEEAQKRAEAALKKLRYEGGEGYFWINDLQPKMIMHPTSPDLVGKDLSDFKDVNGRYIFKEIVQIVENKGAGYLEYHWKQPGGKENADKISYVSEFKPWHWIIGTGTYLDDVDKRFWQGVEASLIPLLVIYSIIGILVQLISVSIKRPLSSLVKEFNQVAEGDLSNPMKLQNRGDEFGLLSQAAAAMIENFRRFISLNHEGANNLEMTEQALSESSSVTVAGMQQQHVETDTLATAIEEMAATVAELARNASETSELTDNAQRQIKAGEQQMDRTRVLANQVAKDIENASQVVTKLERDVKEIDSILSVIRNISEQTNLLALNAAIEAARAGESGRGFAVVADEVRGLAKRTHDCTEEIQTLTERLDSESNEAVAAMQAGQENVRDSVNMAEEASKEMKLIAQQVDEINERNTQIAAAVEEQGAVAQDISKNILNIREISEHTVSTTSVLGENSDKLKTLTAQTRQLLSSFKL